jgi:hypothetical protein
MAGLNLLIQRVMLKLMKGFSTDLRGNINFGINNGTTIKLVFLFNPVSVTVEDVLGPQLKATAS